MIGLTDNEFTPVPPATGVPPQLTVYQSVVNPAPGAVTEIVDDEPLQIDAGLAAIPDGVAGNAFTVIVAAPPVKPLLRVQPLPSTDTNV